MSFGDSKAIVTNQTGIHENLTSIVKKHLTHEFLKPMQSHTVDAFNQVNDIVQNFKGSIILDACCGVGQSSQKLASLNPQALVIGVDKSAHRIAKHQAIIVDKNYLLVQADLNDFYRLVAKSNWVIEKHYLLYPNPWPKAKHVQRRWHGAAVFPTLISLAPELELRSNWRLYLEEFQAALAISGIDSTLSQIVTDDPITPFEKKYLASGQACWQLLAKISKHPIE